jgi:hypothetical protein
MIALDVLVGVSYLLAALSLRRAPRLALLASATGLLWFAGDLAEPLVFAHRAPLSHLLLLYPEIRFQRRGQRWLVGAFYAACLIYPIGRLDGTTVALFVAVVVATLVGRRASPGASRRSIGLARAGAVLIWGLLVAATLARSAGAHLDAALLVAYEIILIAVVAVVVLDERYRRSRAAIVTNLAVDLGAERVRTLRDLVADALGDPSVVLGLVTPDGLMDEAGQPVTLRSRSGQVTTDLLERRRRIAVLQHDPALLRDRRLLDSVAALTAIALANVRLHQEVVVSIAEVTASRRRLLAVSDAERDRLEDALQVDVMARLARVSTIFAQLRSNELCGQLESSRETIRLFARGVYPRALNEVGLAAIRDLDRLGDVTITVPNERFAPQIEAAAYFLCLEALTNVAKYAHATTVTVSVRTVNGKLLIEIADDGIGGTDPAKGSGLLGLRDRLDALGGVLTVQTSPDGTLIRGSIPLDPPKSRFLVQQPETNTL